MEPVRRSFMLLLLAAVAAVFIATVATAQTIGTPATIQTGGVQIGCIITGTMISPGMCVLSSVPYMMIGILLSFMVIALTYMIGNVINYSRMKDWYKTELWETIKSLLLVVIIMASLVLLSAVDPQYHNTVKPQCDKHHNEPESEQCAVHNNRPAGHHCGMQFKRRRNSVRGRQPDWLPDWRPMLRLIICASR